MPRSFVISDAQMQAFSDQQRKRFADEMVVYFRQEYPKESANLGEEGLRELIDEGIETAKGYHIVLEPEVADYLELMVAVAPDFDTSSKTPWAQGILTDDTLTGPEKIERVWEHLMFEGPAEEDA
jgi:hypothetical protein